MINFKFTPEMFEKYNFNHADYAAQVANEALQTEMSKWVKVYGKDGENWGRETVRSGTHFAYLTPPQLIEKEPCKHEPEEWYKHSCGLSYNKCKHCGVELKATWSAAKSGSSE